MSSYGEGDSIAFDAGDVVGRDKIGNSIQTTYQRAGGGMSK